MTQEEKAKAYDEAIKVIKDNLNALNEISKTGVNIQTIKNCFYRVFPELKESEDERIRKELIKIVNDHYSLFKEIDRAKTIAWLEKQGEQKPDEVRTTGYQNVQDIEQKPIDKVEPKFKVGDWVVLFYQYQTEKKVVQIDSIEYFENGEPKYITSEGRWFSNEDKARLWTIQDAKDGDVLSYRTGQWIFIYKEKINNTCFSYYALYSTVYQDLTINDSGFTLLIDSVAPATKEQRDTLMKAIANAGYTFDFEKKELRKIEQKQKWSEEDEKMLECAIDMIEWYSVVDKIKSRRVSDWLESLRLQRQWKPSGEQMEFLYKYAEQNNYDGTILTSLYNDLKQLK